MCSKQLGGGGGHAGARGGGEGCGGVFLSCAVCLNISVCSMGGQGGGACRRATLSTRALLLHQVMHDSLRWGEMCVRTSIRDEVVKGGEAIGVAQEI